MCFGCGIFPFKAGLWRSLSACGAVSGWECGPPCHCHVVVTFGLTNSWIGKVLHVFFSHSEGRMKEDKAAETVTSPRVCYTHTSAVAVATAAGDS